MVWLPFKICYCKQDKIKGQGVKTKEKACNIYHLKDNDTKSGYSLPEHSVGILLL